MFCSSLERFWERKGTERENEPGEKGIREGRRIGTMTQNSTEPGNKSVGPGEEAEELTS